MATQRPLFNRRAFLHGGLILGSGALVAACGRMGGGSGVGGGGGADGGGDGGAGDGGHTIGPPGCITTRAPGAPLHVTNGMDFAQIKTVIESTATGGVVNFENGVYELTTGNQNAEIVVPAGVTINGNCAELRVYGATRTAALTNSTQRLYLRVYGSNTTINHLVLRGRCAIWIGGDDIELDNVVVDQGNRYTDYADLEYNRLDNAYSCFVVMRNSNRVTFNDCEAWYADHHGFSVYNSPFGSTGLHHDIAFYRCSAMHCGSGWEIDGSNPWARGFDLFESPGTMTGLVVDGCYAYDCLQSGYYIEGNYDGHPQSISGVIRNSHAENCGIRIAQASINGTPLIVGLNGKEYGVPVDVYGDGYYLSGDIQVVNCTSRNNLFGFTIDGADVTDFQDEGSYFGGSIAGGRLENFISVSAQVFALVSYNTIGGSVGVIDFDSAGRAPILFNWLTFAVQRKIAPRSYKDLYTNDSAVRLTDNQLATTQCRFTRGAGCQFGTSVAPSLRIVTNDPGRGTFDTAVKGWYHSPATSANVAVEYAASIPTLTLPPPYH